MLIVPKQSKTYMFTIQTQKPLWKDAIKWTEDAFVLQIFRIMVPFSELRHVLDDPVQMLVLMKEIWMFPKIVGFPQIIHFNRVFHYFHHPFWGFSPYFWFNTHMV